MFAFIDLTLVNFKALLVITIVVLLFGDKIRPVIESAFSKAKAMISEAKPSVTPEIQVSISDRVRLWESLYDACDPKNGGCCVEAQVKLKEVFPLLAPECKVSPKAMKRA